MPRWKTQAVIENNSIIELKRLTRFGNSFALILPRGWVTLHCGADNGSYLVKVNINQGEITIAGYKRTEVKNDRTS